MLEPKVMSPEEEDEVKAVETLPTFKDIKKSSLVHTRNLSPAKIVAAP